VLVAFGVLQWLPARGVAGVSDGPVIEKGVVTWLAQGAERYKVHAKRPGRRAVTVASGRVGGKRSRPNWFGRPGRGGRLTRPGQSSVLRRYTARGRRSGRVRTASEPSGATS
jgi:hypothetical protein